MFPNHGNVSVDPDHLVAFFNREDEESSYEGPGVESRGSKP
jgi:hypothetical protein